MTNAVKLDESKIIRGLYYNSISIPQNSKFIRVLDVREPADNDESPLLGSLRLIDLANEPPFSALSYVWGEDNKGCIISCDGVQLPITANGYSALQHLRRKFGAYTIWIDAICIDQGNNEEKARQIPLMGDIYHLAAPVYVWLGESDQGSDRAIDLLGRTAIVDCFLSDIETQMPRNKPRLWSATWRFGRLPSLPFVQEMSYPIWWPTCLLSRKRRLKSQRASVSDLLYLMERAWISRVWTFQEIVLARQPIVVCGDRHLSWAPFSWNILILSRFCPLPGLKDWEGVVQARSQYRHVRLMHTQSHSLRSYQQAGLHTEQKMISFLNRSLRIMSIWGAVLMVVALSSPGLAIVLFVLSALKIKISPTKEIELSDPHYAYIIGGSVFILIFMLSAPLAWSVRRGFVHYTQREVDRVNPDPTAQWINVIIKKNSKMPQDKAFGVQGIMQNLIEHRLPKPNYESPLPQIYRDLCATILDVMGSLHFLLPAALNHLHGAPSWVPDMREPVPDFWAGVVGTRDMQRAVWHPVVEDPNILQVQGRQLGIVKSTFVFRPVADILDVSEASKLHIENLRTLLRLVTGPKSRERLWVIGESLKILNIQNPPQRWYALLKSCRGQDPKELYHQWRSAPAWKFCLYKARFPLIDPLCWWNTLSWLLLRGDPSSLTEAVCDRLAKDSRLLLLYEGYGGPENIVVGTGDIKAGDRIVYLYGGPCAFVVRIENDVARLIGPVYSSQIPSCDPVPTEDALSKMPEVKLKLR